MLPYLSNIVNKILIINSPGRPTPPKNNKKMSKEKVSDFKIMDKIASEGSPDGIAMFPNLLRGKLAKKGGEITFGVPANALGWTLKGSHYFVLYAIKKEDYNRVLSELETANVPA